MSHKPHWHIAPYFIVDDVVTTANWYRDRLGFEYDRFWGEPPVFCMVRRNGGVIMLSQLPGRARPNHTVDPERGAWDAYIRVEDPDALTAREREVLELMVEGITSNRRLAKRLGVSENTVKFHVRNILDKLHLHDRAQAVGFALRTKVVRLAEGATPAG